MHPHRGARAGLRFYRDTELALVIIDNGSGVTPGTATEGKGLSVIKRRAAAAGVALAVLSSPQGTSIEIELPARSVTHDA